MTETLGNGGSQDAKPTRPTCLKVILAPWIYLFRPSQASRCFLTASWWAVGMSFVIHACMLGVIANGLAVLDLTVSSKMKPIQAPGQAGMIYYVPSDPQPQTIGEAWNAWSGVWPGWPVVMMVGLGFAALSAAAIFAGLLFPKFLDRRNVLDAWLAAFRCVVSACGVLILSVAVIGTAAVGFFNVADLQGEFGVRDIYLAYGVISMAFIPAACASLLCWTLRGGRGATTHEPRLLKFWCEGCGYDLTHVPQDRLCPECGLNVDESLLPERRRVGLAWQNRKNFECWLGTSIYIIAATKFISRRIRVQDDPRHATRFARRHYGFMGMAAAVWIVLLLSNAFGGAPDFMEVVVVGGVIVFAIPLIGWTLQHALGALASFLWCLREKPAYPASAAVVIDYQTPFLWLFCLFNGAMITSIALFFEAWESPGILNTFTRQTVQLPLFPAVLILGNILLVLLWFRRLHSVLQAVRWSNF